jgi:hypothetical protein
MSKENQKLITYLQGAMDACTVKVGQLRTAVGNDHQELATVEQEMKTLFNDFNKPDLWVHPVEYDENQLVKKILEVRIADAQDPTPFIERIRKLMTYLRQTVLTEAQSWLEAADTSTWNQKMLDELLKVRRVLRETKKRFADGGYDFDGDADFLAIETRFTDLLAIYRKKLRENEVSTDENDISSMVLLQTLIQSSPDVPAFKVNYQMLNTFIAEKCGESTDDPA